MKKIIFGIFAHPDDEAFGPAGTLLSEVKHGAELHLICFTAGQNGLNPDNIPNLHKVRLKEWDESARRLGAFSKHHLGYVDGKIGNFVMLKAVDQIKKIMREVVNSHVVPVEVEVITMDTNGITGHIDHIAVSRAAHHVFYDLKAEGMPLKRLRVHCLPRAYTGDEPNTDFVFMEPGRLPGEIDEVVDNSQYCKEVIEVMKVHHTQRQDCKTHLDQLGDKVAIDHFIVKK